MAKTTPVNAEWQNVDGAMKLIADHICRSAPMTGCRPLAVAAAASIVGAAGAKVTAIPTNLYIAAIGGALENREHVCSEAARICEVAKVGAAARFEWDVPPELRAPRPALQGRLASEWMRRDFAEPTSIFLALDDGETALRLSPSAFHDGLISKFVFVLVGDGIETPVTARPAEDVPQAIIDALDAIAHPEGYKIAAPDDRRVHRYADASAKLEMEDFDKAMKALAGDPAMASVLSDRSRSAAKLALTHAAQRKAGRFALTFADVDWALNFLYPRFMDARLARLAKSSNIGLEAAVIDRIEQRGGTITRRDLIRSLQAQADMQEVDGVIRRFSDANRIEVHTLKPAGGGRPSVRYSLVQSAG